MDIERGSKENSMRYKEEGNTAFKHGNYQKAVESYTKAIELNESESVFYSNRARCYKAMRMFDLAYEDAKVAVEMDDKNIKAHALLGQCLAEKGKLEPGIERLETAHARLMKSLTLCAGQKKQEYEKELQRNILRLRKLIWFKKDEALRKRKLDMLANIKRLMARDSSLNEEERTKKYEDIVELLGNPSVIPERTVPDYLCCQISHDLMEDPVTTQSGYTYERSNLRDHLAKNGNIDPVTRDSINPTHIFPNLNVKQAIEAFLKECPWGFEFKKNEDYHSITF
eukprot:TRINITY_DN230_c0_g1_i4.p1 TRINITY_DN230_c0_g1~~TRINITY_DN230_c0_g1_i4.p1  ORF type:complete len:283 (-),score=63.78 TRINITY_DN230_c0_g1_i4:141-989(-)